MTAGPANPDTSTEKKEPALPAFVNDDDRTMLLKEWRTLRRISPATERRMRKQGLGPKTVNVSSGRLGVTVRADREWMEAGGARGR